MPPLVCPPPTVLDQSFPRDADELQAIAGALGSLQGCVEKNLAHVALTDTLGRLVEQFDWGQPRAYPAIQEVYRLLTQWLLQPSVRIIKLDVSKIKSKSPHPMPDGWSPCGLAADWCTEAARLLIMHDEFAPTGAFFLAVACASAFRGGPLGRYKPCTDLRILPLAGPRELSRLRDAYEWIRPVGFANRPVTFAKAYSNVHLLGASRIERPPGGSHYKVHFPGAARPWPLDPNADPVPERYLAELANITKVPLPAVKASLVTGKPPKRGLLCERYRAGARR